MNFSMYNFPPQAQQAAYYGQRFVSPSNTPLVPPTIGPPYHHPYPVYSPQTNSYDHIIRSAAETLAAFTRPPDVQHHSSRRPTHKSSTTSNSTQMFYCETCRIACAGQATYQSHLNGSKHKKKENNAQTSQTTSGNSFRCELCDITCTSVDAYKAHLEGNKHEKAMKLHRKLGKTIPDVELPLNNSTTTNPQEEKLVTIDNSMKLIGEEYIEITFDETRKPIVFHCKLCDCKFNDANAKDAHLKGKRHRLSYRKKVDPNFQVDQNPSAPKRLPSPKPRTNDVIQETSSSSNEIDDETRYLMTLHEQIIPKSTFLNFLEEFASAIESALKLSSDELRSSSSITLLGVSRVGLFAKSLLIQTDREFQLVVMCSDWPTFDLIEKLSTILQNHFPVKFSSENRIEIRWTKNEEKIQIETIFDEETTLIGTIFFTSKNVENEENRSNEFLSKTICLESLNAMKSVRWFQSQLATRQHASALIRCFRSKSFPTEIVENLVEFALTKRTTPVAVFRFVLEMIAAGFFLSSSTNSWQNDITAEAQFGLRLMSFGQLNRWFEQNTTSVGKRSHPDDRREISTKRQRVENENQ